MPHKANPQHFQELNLVITQAEAVRLYKIYRQTLTYAIDAGNIAAVRCGRNVLVSRRSLEAYLKSSRS